MTDVAFRSKIDAPASSGIDRRQFLWGGSLLAAAGAAAVLTPRRSIRGLAKGTLDRVIPKSIGSYSFQTESGLVTPPQDELSEMIYDEVLTRVYGAPDLPAIMLLIAYGSAQDAGLALHRPEFCYPAQGYKLSRSQSVPLAGVGLAGAQATFLTASREGGSEQIFYWNRIGDRYPVSGTDEKRAVFSANLRGSLPDGVLVRLSTVTNDRNGALAPLEQFNSAMIASLGTIGRRILLGAQNITRT